MDIDIDDILAELDRDTTLVGRSDGLLGSDGNTTRVDTSMVEDGVPKGRSVSSGLSAAADFKKLVQCWRNERCAPELLPYPHELIERVLERVRDQMEYIENISMGFLEESTSQGFSGIRREEVDFDDDDDENLFGARGNRHANIDNKLPLLCMEAELERVKFVLRTFIRCRFSKIDKYALYLKQLQNAEEEENSLNKLLSEQELVYYEKHFRILLKLLNNSVLRHMPAELQAIDDTEGSVSMIEEPDWKKFVFIYVNEVEDDTLLERNEFGKPCYAVTITDLNEVVELTLGGIYVMRYEVIRPFLMENKVQLI